MSHVTNVTKSNNGHMSHVTNVTKSNNGHMYCTHPSTHARTHMHTHSVRIQYTPPACTLPLVAMADTDNTVRTTTTYASRSIAMVTRNPPCKQSVSHMSYS